MKKIKAPLVLIMFTILLLSCGNDDENIQLEKEKEKEPTLSELREETTKLLIADGSKIWKVSNAELVSDGKNIDISANFNVQDDEFIFTGESNTIQSVLWKQRYDINTKASTPTEAKLDFYRSSISSLIKYQDESSAILTANEGSWNFEVGEGNSLKVTIKKSDGSEFNFELIEKTSNDYLIPSSSTLNFTKAFTFESNAITNRSPGMVGSYSDNSFFMVTREDGLANSNGNPERLLKFDLDNTMVTEKLFFKSDLLAKQLHIVNSKLVVVGGQYINEYDLDIVNDPKSTSHGKFLSRCGVAVLDGNIYIIGGDLNDVEGDKVFKWDTNTETLVEFATMPEARSGARGTIVDGYLYVFGGSTKLLGNPAKKTIYKIEIANPTNIEAFEMNKEIDFTFVQKRQNLIYVAGRIEVRDNDGMTTGRESTIGVFNTIDNTYTELNSNLTNSDGFETIHQMCVLNNKMYIIYGNEGVDKGGQFNEWEVLVSDLN